MSMGMGLITPYPSFMPKIEDILYDALNKERRAARQMRMLNDDMAREAYATARLNTDEAILVLESEIHNMRQIISNHENQKKAQVRTNPIKMLDQ